MGIASDSEDENDALAIAYWTPNCMTTYQHSEQVAKEKVLKANKTRSELVRTRKINTLMKKLMRNNSLFALKCNPAFLQ